VQRQSLQLLDNLYEATGTKEVSDGVWKFQGKEGVWRSTKSGHEIFIPSDGSPPMGNPKVVKAMKQSGEGEEKTFKDSMKTTEGRKEYFAKKGKKVREKLESKFGKKMGKLGGATFDAIVDEVQGYSDVAAYMKKLATGKSKDIAPKERRNLISYGLNTLIMKKVGVGAALALIPPPVLGIAVGLAASSLAWNIIDRTLGKKYAGGVTEATNDDRLVRQFTDTITKAFADAMDKTTRGEAPDEVMMKAAKKAEDSKGRKPLKLLTVTESDDYISRMERRIQSIRGWENKEMFRSFLSQVKRGKKLSAKQLRVVDKAAPSGASAEDYDTTSWIRIRKEYAYNLKRVFILSRLERIFSYYDEDDELDDIIEQEQRRALRQGLELGIKKGKLLIKRIVGKPLFGSDMQKILDRIDFALEAKSRPKHGDGPNVPDTYIASSYKLKQYARKVVPVGNWTSLAPLSSIGVALDRVRRRQPVSRDVLNSISLAKGLIPLLKKEYDFDKKRGLPPIYDIDGTIDSLISG